MFYTTVLRQAAFDKMINDLLLGVKIKRYDDDDDDIAKHWVEKSGKV